MKPESYFIVYSILHDRGEFILLSEIRNNPDIAKCCNKFIDELDNINRTLVKLSNVKKQIEENIVNEIKQNTL